MSDADIVREALDGAEAEATAGIGEPTAIYEKALVALTRMEDRDKRKLRYVEERNRLKNQLAEAEQLLVVVERLRAAALQAKDALESILVRKDLDWQARAVRALHELSEALS